MFRSHPDGIALFFLGALSQVPANLPYLAAPGSIKTALEKMKSAATPDRVTGDFIQTKLQIKGGTGAAIPPFLKKIGFVASDGSPTQIYHRFRNSQTSGEAVAEAIRIGYRELFQINEYCYELNSQELMSLICQITGAAANSSSAKLTVSSFSNLNNFADFESKANSSETLAISNSVSPAPLYVPPDTEGKLGLNLSYTINLNLPATSDQAVFNAIFRSLREHLLNEK